MMIMSMDKNELLSYVTKQLNSIFPDSLNVSEKDFGESFEKCLARLEKCFQPVRIKGYKKNGIVYFDHLHSDQYTQFLYFLANQLWKDGGDERICSKLTNLIRIISGMFVTYKCNLPEIFLFYHSVGSVIGNAKYSDYLVVFQNVTINTSFDSEGNAAPELGRGLFLATGAKIIGNKSIGDRVSLGANVCVYNQEIPDDAVVTNENNKLTIRKRIKNNCLVQQYFDVKI